MKTPAMPHFEVESAAPNKRFQRTASLRSAAAELRRSPKIGDLGRLRAARYPHQDDRDNTSHSEGRAYEAFRA